MRKVYLVMINPNQYFKHVLKFDLDIIYIFVNLRQAIDQNT